MSKLSNPNPASGVASTLTSLPRIKSVLLVGKGMAITPEIRAAYAPEHGNAIIGDGVSEISTEQLESLRGKVDSSTRFDIDAHGNIETGFFSRAKYHTIDLTVEDYETRDVIKKINNLVGGKPVEVHLWSCFGADEMRLVRELAKGSIFVAHAQKSSIATGGVLDSGILSSINVRNTLTLSSEDKLDYNNVLKTIHLGSEDGIHIAVNVPSFAASNWSCFPIVSYTSLDFARPPLDIIKSEAAIKEFYASISASLFSALSTNTKKPSSIHVPTTNPQKEFSAEDLDIFRENTLLKHTVLDTKIEDIAEATVGNVSTQQYLFKKLLLTKETLLLPFIKALQARGENIHHLFTDGEYSFASISPYSNHLPKVVKLSEDLGISESLKSLIDEARERSYAVSYKKLQEEIAQTQAEFYRVQEEKIKDQEARFAAKVEVLKLKCALETLESQKQIHALQALLDSHDAYLHHAMGSDKHISINTGAGTGLLPEVSTELVGDDNAADVSQF